MTKRSREVRGLEYLAARLRRARQESGLTLREIAIRAQWYGDRSYLSRGFSGKQTLALPLLKRVASALDLDHAVLLTEAGLNEESYRSRHSERRSGPLVPVASAAFMREVLGNELEAVRELKRRGKPEEARGAIGALERLVKHSLGGLPRDRQTILAWASLLLERVGVAQDIQMPHTVLAETEPDLKAVMAIADELEAHDLRAACYFYSGDAHFKGMDFRGAIDHYQQAANYAPTSPLRARSLAGWAIALAWLNEDDRDFQGLDSEARDLIGEDYADEESGYVWDSERWLIARLWVKATLARALVVRSDFKKAADEIEAVECYYGNVAESGFSFLPFEMSLAQLRFLAGCQGAFDMSEDQIIESGFRAFALAQKGGSIRPQREVEKLMLDRFGVRIGSGGVDAELI